MERSTKSKFFFVIVIGIIMLIFAVKLFFFDGKKQAKNSDDEFVEIENSYTNSIDGQAEDEEPTQNNQESVGKTEVDYEEEYIKKFGKEKVEEAKQLTEKVIQSWLENDTNMEMWNEISTPPFLILVKSELLAPKDQITRKVKNKDVSVTKPDEDGDIKLMVYVTWDLLSGGKVVKEQSNMYELTLTLSETGEWLVKELNRA